MLVMNVSTGELPDYKDTHALEVVRCMALEPQSLPNSMEVAGAPSNSLSYAQLARQTGGLESSHGSCRNKTLQEDTIGDAGRGVMTSE